MSGEKTDTRAKLSSKQAGKMLDRLRVTSGNGFKLKHRATDDPAPDIVDKDQAASLLEQGVRRLATMQELLYANSTWSLLIVCRRWTRPARIRRSNTS